LGGKDSGIAYVSMGVKKLAQAYVSMGVKKLATVDANDVKQTGRNPRQNYAFSDEAGMPCQNSWPMMGQGCSGGTGMPRQYLRSKRDRDAPAIPKGLMVETR